MLRRILFIIFLIIVLLPLFFVFSSKLSAATDPFTGAGAEGEVKPDDKAPAEGIVPEGEKTIDNPLGKHNLQYVVTQVFHLAFGLAGLIALIYLIIGGYQYITSSGNPDAAEAAKGTIINSIIGLIIVLTSFLLVDFALKQIGAGGW